MPPPVKNRIEYKGFTIIKSGGQWNHYYQIFKDNALYSNLCLNSFDVAKRCIDTWFKRCGVNFKEIFDRNIKKEQVFIPPHKEPEKPITVRELWLSEHEKYIANLLDEK